MHGLATSDRNLSLDYINQKFPNFLKNDVQCREASASRKWEKQNLCFQEKSKNTTYASTIEVHWKREKQPMLHKNGNPSM